MDAIAASAESFADRHLRLRELLRGGGIADPERSLFLLLLDEPHAPPVATPLLYDASWGGGRFDLLFTDGCGTWCAVEVKDAPEIYGSSNQRKNRRIKHNRKYRLLLAQSRDAWLAACARFPGDQVLGLALWRTDEWVVIREYGPGVKGASA